MHPNCPRFGRRDFLAAGGALALGGLVPAGVHAGEKVAVALEDAGIDVLLDDRDERAGVKFKDADLVGIPYRINVGKKAASGLVELVSRAKAQSKDVALDAVVHEVKARIAEEQLLAASS